MTMGTGESSESSRYLADGSLDKSFSSDGMATLLDQDFGTSATTSRFNQTERSSSSART